MVGGSYAPLTLMAQADTPRSLPDVPCCQALRVGCLLCRGPEPSTRLPSYKTLQKSQNFPQVRGLSKKISRLPKTLTSVRSDFRSKFLEAPQSFQKPEAWLQKSVVLLTKMDLTEFRSSTRIGTGSGGLAAWDGFRRVNVLDGLPQSGQSSMPHGTRSRRLCGMTISAPSHRKASTLNRKPPFLVPALAPLSTPRRGGASLARIGFRV